MKFNKLPIAQIEATETLSKARDAQFHNVYAYRPLDLDKRKNFKYLQCISNLDIISKMYYKYELLAIQHSIN